MCVSPSVQRFKHLVNCHRPELHNQWSFIVISTIRHFHLTKSSSTINFRQNSIFELLLSYFSMWSSLKSDENMVAFIRMILVLMQRCTQITAHNDKPGRVSVEVWPFWLVSSSQRAKVGPTGECWEETYRFTKYHLQINQKYPTYSIVLFICIS